MTKGIYLSLGTNLGDREKNLLVAIKKINEQIGPVLKVSSLYQTQPWGVSEQPEFLNQVIEIKSSQRPLPLMESLQQIERELGRKKNEHWGPRVIDLDILFYGYEEISLPGLVVPHIGIAERRFTLVPLCELAADLIHPVLKKSCGELLEECPDQLAVNVYVPNNS